jgi:hypothetical protein
VWQDSLKAIIIVNCYEFRDQILRSDIMEVLHQPPFPGFYKTKDSVDLDTLRQSFHVQYGTDPISIERFLEFLADISKPRGRHGEGAGQGGYGYD